MFHQPLSTHTLPLPYCFERDLKSYLTGRNLGTFGHTKGAFLFVNYYLNLFLYFVVNVTPELSITCLKDFTFINDGNPDHIRDGLINVFKRRQVSKIILEIRQYQMQPYYFETVDFIKRIINQIQTVTLEDYKLYTSGVSTNPSIQSLLSLGNIQLVDEDTLWDRSLELEPRQPQQ